MGRDGGRPSLKWTNASKNLRESGRRFAGESYYSAMFGHLIMPALLAIAISTFILRIVIGYLVKPTRTRNASKRFTMLEPRRLGRGAARLLYGRKPKGQIK